MSPNPNGVVLIVDENAQGASLLGTYLEQHDFHADYATDGLRALALLEANTYSAVVLDEQLPRMPGTTVLQTLRDNATTATLPIVLLTSCTELQTRLDLFLAGADDVLAKPFEFPELLARLVALLRRRREEVVPKIHRLADLTYDVAEGIAWRGKRLLILRPTGFRLLNILLRESPRFVSRKELESELWGLETPDSDSLRSHLYSLRKAIDAPDERPLMQTFRGMGYALVDDHDREPLGTRNRLPS